MHLVFLNQYYPPDAAPTGAMLEGLVEELFRQGNEVTVICAEGGYADSLAGGEGQLIDDQQRFGPRAVDGVVSENRRIRVMRIGATQFGRKFIFGKMIDYVSYYAGTAWSLMTMKPPPDRVIAMTTPPYLSILARALSKVRGGDHAHWVMDLYPDILVAHGIIKDGGMTHRLLSFSARLGFGGSRCAAVVTLGPDMADRVKIYVCPARKVEWVPLWGKGCTNNREVDQIRYSDREAVSKLEQKESKRELRLRRERGWNHDDLVIMYSGNFGRGHRFGEIMSVACLLVGRNASIDFVKAPVRFVFYGEGVRKRQVADFAKEHPECKIELHDYVATEILNEHLKSADIHLVSLEKNWAGTMVPSKLQGIFAAGRPAILIGSKDSSIARWIDESGGGWVVEQGDIDGLRQAILEGSDPSVRRKRGEAALVYASRHFSKEKNTERIARLLSKG